ncbi:glycine cleavage system protein GcvH [Haloimpatiens lingqiaonensis]|uniref:glycine cleavage system protein GcvH n=1 Tax=Haloimpatiens lingqiaonensis TaxID=1380675 RepID=UPI0010FF0D36|nr:glycine cleavage system protein GcvH [Haloimpatiens lingqiaonensis]
MKVIDGLYYSKEHEWVKLDGDTAYIGITDYAQDALGDIVYVELPEVDDEILEGDALSVVESVKAASDVYMPIDGKVIEVNEALDDEVELVNNDPFNSWIAKVEILNKDQIKDLMSAQEYQEFCSKEA